jgi:6-methylsalicylate decarboxylase
VMDAAGVDLQVLSPSSLVPDLADPDAAARAARIGNDRLSAVTRRWPDRFAMFGVVPLANVASAIEGIDDALARPGCAGIGVATSVRGRSIADPSFDPLFEELDRRSAVIFIHPAGRGADSTLVQSLGFDWLIGATLEATIAVTHLIARGIPSRFPRLRIVNVQLGGALPMLVGRLDNQFPRAVPDAPEPPSIAARRMWYDTVVHAHGPALVAAAASLGVERLVLGSDYPYVRGDRYREAIEFVGSAGLTPEQAGAILDANAARLIGY